MFQVGHIAVSPDDLGRQSWADAIPALLKTLLTPILFRLSTDRLGH
jgi:hypothetical protein